MRLGGKPAALAQQSYYQPAALGNEAATKAWGMSVVTHQITGKTYFQAWSMDVQIEGKFVCRHGDITTSNHASAPGATPPNPNLEAVDWGELEDEELTCACCNGPRHSAGTPMTMDDWYTLDSAGNLAPHAADYTALMRDVANRKTASDPCTCNSRLVPGAPCNVFRRPVTEDEKRKNRNAWERLRDTYQKVLDIPTIAEATASLAVKLGYPPTKAEIQDERQVNHLVPKLAAGGCPVGDNNLEKNGDLCRVCRALDRRFGALQSLAARA